MQKLSKQEKQLKKQKIKENKKYIKDKTINKNFPKNTQLSENVILEARNVKKIIAKEDQRFEIIKGINLDIYQQEFVMIFGESGSGKTSLISMLSGLERPSEGNVNINTYNTSPLNQSQLTKLRKQEIGYIFQQYGLLKDLTVLENVIIILESVDQKRILKKNKEFIMQNKKLMKKYGYLLNYEPYFYINGNLNWQISDMYYFSCAYNVLYNYINYMYYSESDGTYDYGHYVQCSENMYQLLIWNDSVHIDLNCQIDCEYDFNNLVSSHTININCFLKEKLKNIFYIMLDTLREQIFQGEFIFEVLKKLEIDRLINKKVVFLSGGQQQRVSISRAVAKKPHILFADEPTGAVDSNTAKLIMELFIKLNYEFGTTIVMVTHNSNLSCIASRNITIADGLIINDEYNYDIKSIDEVNFR